MRQIYLTKIDGRAPRQFSQWPGIEHPTFQLTGRHATTELFADLGSHKM